LTITAWKQVLKIKVNTFTTVFKMKTLAFFHTFKTIKRFVMKKAFLIFFFFAEALLANAQLLQERLYNISTKRTGIHVSTLTKQGNIFLSGVIDMKPAVVGFQDVFLLVKPDTDTLWTRKGPLLKNGAHAISQALGNSLFFTGQVRASVASKSDIVLEKLNLNGNQLFRKTIDFGDIDYGACLKVMPNKDLLIAGWGCLTNPYSRFAITRFDSLGNTIRWQKDYQWTISDGPSHMEFTNNGNIILIGPTFYNSFVRLKLLVIDQNGDSVLGARPSIVGTNRREETLEIYNGLTVLSDGGYLITGEIDTVINSLPRYMSFVAKLNSNLQPVWRYVQRSKLSGDYYYSKSRELADGSLLVLSFGANNQFYFSRFSPTGTLLNTYTFTSNVANKVITATLEYLPSDSTFIIAGEATVTPQPNYTSAFYVAKVKLPPSVPQVLSTKPEIVQAESLLGQSYPNPATDAVIIPFNLPNSYKQANIIIRDITGREVGNYAIKKHSSTLEVNLSNFSNGLYTYTLLLDEKPVATKKLAVLK
jgi:hypothetical protein